MAEHDSRKLSYEACRKLGTEGKPAYLELLEKARAFHQKKIEGSIGLAGEEANKFSATLTKLEEHREFSMQYTLTDLENDSSKLADLLRAHEETRLWFEEAGEQHGRAAASFEVVFSSASALDEIRRELAYCGGKKFTIAGRTFDRILSKHSNAASNLHDRLAELMSFSKAQTDYEAATRHNRAQTWASSEMRAFADLLNARRLCLGLPILRLEDRLCEACEKHAHEMVRLEYFDHRSPVRQNATPELRVKNSRYRGTFVGENIFFYSSPKTARGAFDAWWKSDGHRCVMFDPKPNELGLSNSTGTHWTLVTGVAAPSPKAPTAVQVK